MLPTVVIAPPDAGGCPDLEPEGNDSPADAANHFRDENRMVMMEGRGTNTDRTRAVPDNKWFYAVAALAATGCSGRQSALEPAGREAERIASLFWWMGAGTVIVWLVMIWLTWSAVKGRVADQTARQASFYIIGGGAVFPTVVLAALLIYGLGMMPALVARAPEGSLTIKVTGEQWWWRVHYQMPDGEELVLANEVRLPVGEPVQFTLESADVIHSFWIPSIGGKMDMIPGRTTHLALLPQRIGRYRGVCAEYCGGSHALMAFDVLVVAKDEFERWIEQQRAPAAEPAEDIALRGREEFLRNGCGACHGIRGTIADGVVGPDLTHVGGRLSIGAGILPNEPGAFEQWLRRTDQIKPAVHMPHFGMLERAELEALAAYLNSLK